MRAMLRQPSRVVPAPRASCSPSLDLKRPELSACRWGDGREGRCSPEGEAGEFVQTGWLPSAVSDCGAKSSLA